MLPQKRIATAKVLPIALVLITFCYYNIKGQVVNDWISFYDNQEFNASHVDSKGCVYHIENGLDIVKRNANGTVAWANLFTVGTGTTYESVAPASLVADNSCNIVGAAKARLSNLPPPPTMNSEEYKLLVTLRDSSGTYQWSYFENLSGTGNVTVCDMKADASGNVFVLRHANHYVNQAVVGQTLNMLKISSTGSLVWTSGATGVSNEEISGPIASMDFDASGNAYVAYSSRSGSSGSYSGRVMKVNANGTIAWNQTAGTSLYLTNESGGNAKRQAVVVHSNGQVSAIFNQSVTGASQLSATEFNSGFVFTLSSSTGATIWSKEFSRHAFNELATDSFGNILVAGQRSNKSETIFLPVGILVKLYVSTGNVVWEREFLPYVSSGAISQPNAQINTLKSVVVDGGDNVFVAASLMDTVTICDTLQGCHDTLLCVAKICKLSMHGVESFFDRIFDPAIAFNGYSPKVIRDGNKILATVHLQALHPDPNQTQYSAAIAQYSNTNPTPGTQTSTFKLDLTNLKNKDFLLLGPGYNQVYPCSTVLSGLSLLQNESFVLYLNPTDGICSRVKFTVGSNGQLSNLEWMDQSGYLTNTQFVTLPAANYSLYSGNTGLRLLPSTFTIDMSKLSVNNYTFPQLSSVTAGSPAGLYTASLFPGEYLIRYTDLGTALKFSVNQNQVLESEVWYQPALTGAGFEFLNPGFYQDFSSTRLNIIGQGYVMDITFATGESFTSTDMVTAQQVISAGTSRTWKLLPGEYEGTFNVVSTNQNRAMMRFSIEIFDGVINSSMTWKDLVGNETGGVFAGLPSDNVSLTAKNLVLTGAISATPGGVISPPDLYVELYKSLDGGWVPTVNHILRFKYTERYSESGNLSYKIFDSQNNDVTPSGLNLSKAFGVNWIDMDLSASGYSQSEFYVLEVTDAKGDLYKLRFRYL